MDAIVVSLVRCNRQNKLGFVSNEKRFTVAMTRARRALVVVGDSTILAAECRTWAKWLQFLHERNAIVSATNFCFRVENSQ